MEGRIFDEKEITALVDAALDFWLTAGRYAEKFEQGFTEFLGVKHCSLTNSGPLLIYSLLWRLPLLNWVTGG